MEARAKPWRGLRLSDKDREVLTRLWHDGRAVREIAEVLRLTEYQIHALRHSMGLPKRLPGQSSTKTPLPELDERLKVAKEHPAVRFEDDPRAVRDRGSAGRPILQRRMGANFELGRSSLERV